jgi:glyoxylase-like metal-dependent hydrolase (beta-lactamase superfamily II)
MERLIVMPVYTINIMNLADLVGLDSSFMVRGRNYGEKNTLPTHSFLITGNNIPPIMVDTGVKESWLDDPAKFKNFHMIANIHKIDDELAGIGYTRKDIKILLHTHIHVDHAGNDDLFPDAKIIFARKEMMWSVADIDPGYPTEYTTYFVKQLAVPGKIRLIDEEFELFPGITIQPSEGHTWGCTNIKVNTVKGVAIMCGDILYDYDNQCIKNEQFGETEAFSDSPSGNCWNWWASKAAIQKLNREADILLPSHYKDVIKKYGTVI